LGGLECGSSASALLFGSSAPGFSVWGSPADEGGGSQSRRSRGAAALQTRRPTDPQSGRATRFTHHGRRNRVPPRKQNVRATRARGTGSLPRPVPITFIGMHRGPGHENARPRRPCYDQPQICGHLQVMSAPPANASWDWMFLRFDSHAVTGHNSLNMEPQGSGVKPVGQERMNQNEVPRVNLSNRGVLRWFLLRPCAAVLLP